ncbi:MAG TPA: hypothetical protein VEB66_10660 [Opitutaceae bacterium]|nr:hypothetical protein [Opitutaceae bacterium]
MRSAQLRRLHFLNALFAPLTGSDLYLARQIDAAITTSLEEAVEREPSDPAFVAAAAQLFARLCGANPRHGFFHWDAAGHPAASSPLFARAGLMDGLKRLSRFPESTVLVTNLRAAHCPPDRRWTGRRQREYDDTLSLLQQLAAARSRRGTQLNLLFL